MTTPARSAAVLSLALGAACTGVVADPAGIDGPGPSTRPPPADADAGLPAAPPSGDLDMAATRARFRTTTDLMRLVFAPGCAAERNECHNSEDFPDLSTEGNLWNLVELPCNQALGERGEVESLCEAAGDELRVTDGANEGFTATIGSIAAVLDDEGALTQYEVRLDRPVPSGQSEGRFEILREGSVIPGLGGGASAEMDAGDDAIRVTDPAHLPDPGAIRQGDENNDGIYGDGGGALVAPGDARSSYLVRRLLGHETARIRMPSGASADNPTERRPPLDRGVMWVIMSWVNCMQPGDGPYSEIRYDCPENADNAGMW